MKLKLFDPHETDQMQRYAGIPLASFTSRGIALFIDVLAGSVFTFFIVVLITLTQYFLFHVSERPDTFGNALLKEMIDTGLGTEKPGGDVVVALNPHSSVFTAIGIGIYFAIITYVTNGSSLGKRLMRIRVISLVHEKISVWQSVERALGYSASLAEAGFGFFQYFIHPNRRTVHDRIAETIVIKVVKK
ncbi:MAG: RDD family protein [Bacteroidota bacterium]